MPSPADETRANEFLLERHLKSYETILMDILREKDTGPHEVQQVMRAFIALHTIDGVKQGYISEFMGTLMATLSVEEYMT